MNVDFEEKKNLNVMNIEDSSNFSALSCIFLSFVINEFSGTTLSSLSTLGDICVHIVHVVSVGEVGHVMQYHHGHYLHQDNFW